MSVRVENLDLKGGLTVGGQIWLPGGKQEFLTTNTLSATATNVTFNNIPQTARNLYFEIWARTAASQASGEIGMQFNGISTGIYHCASYAFKHNGLFDAVSTDGVNLTSLPAGYVAGTNDSNDANFWSHTKGVIWDYTNATIPKSFFSVASWVASTAADSVRTRNQSGTAIQASEAAITSLNFLCIGGQTFGIGSTFRIRGQLT